MKKILIATDNFLPRMDGVSVFLKNIIPELLEDFSVSIIAPKFPGEVDKKKYGKIVTINTTKFQVGDINIATPSTRKVKQMVKEADIVWSQTLGPIGILGVYYGRKYNKKVISYIHSVEFELFREALPNLLLKKIASPTTTKLIKYIYKKCDYLLVPSLELAEILSWKGVTTQKIRVPLGVDVKEFKALNIKKEDQLKKEMGFDKKDKLILYVGRLAREKDLKTLLRAFLRIEKKFESVKLIIVGDGLKEIKNMFADKPNIILYGTKENVLPFYQISDIYVLPSHTETTSLTTLEAMSCELPVVCTSVGLMKNYIINGQNGLLFEKEDYLTLTKHLENLLNDVALRDRLGFHARETVKDKFSWDYTVKQIKDILKKL